MISEGKTFLEGPPGTGKTTLAVERMLDLLEAGIPGSSILVLTPQRTLAASYLEALRSPKAPRATLPMPGHAASITGLLSEGSSLSLMAESIVSRFNLNLPKRLPQRPNCSSDRLTAASSSLKVKRSPEEISCHSLPDWTSTSTAVPEMPMLSSSWRFACTSAGRISSYLVRAAWA